MDHFYTSLKGVNMTRFSSDEIVNGIVKNGFDYDLQVWVVGYIIMDCDHRFACGCNARRYAGQDIRSSYSNLGGS